MELEAPLPPPFKKAVNLLRSVTRWVRANEKVVRNLLCPAPAGPLRGKRFLTPLFASSGITWRHAAIVSYRAEACR